MYGVLTDMRTWVFTRLMREKHVSQPALKFVDAARPGGLPPVMPTLQNADVVQEVGVGGVNEVRLKFDQDAAGKPGATAVEVGVLCTASGGEAVRVDVEDDAGAAADAAQRAQL
mmetsp:Transcript_12742/g.44646  ORF Transcript_12742/g.44646 Transcript_12742/m.44646 type:complete len:114 (-) Transcript_12742:128-469(-)